MQKGLQDKNSTLQNWQNILQNKQGSLQDEQNTLQDKQERLQDEQNALYNKQHTVGHRARSMCCRMVQDRSCMSRMHSGTGREERAGQDAE
jgi:hypothetical protein